ncbi:hypothetical protein [uncultured Friedmanniella sp.]|uniref:hypothetical protein n=1 Tax=uncultured Friedmanniella sp. TaxID=335381 RepID=UPI0035CB521B
MPTYTVRTIKWRDGWELHVDGEGVTQARTLEDAPQEVRDYLSVKHGRDFSDARIELVRGLEQYTVTAERSGKWWALQCVEVPGALSQVKKLEYAAEQMREPIAWIAYVPEESVRVVVQVVS